jgi:hypothetical protein
MSPSKLFYESFYGEATAESIRDRIKNHKSTMLDSAVEYKVQQLLDKGVRNLLEQEAKRA